MMLAQLDSSERDEMGRNGENANAELVALVALPGCMRIYIYQSVTTDNLNEGEGSIARGSGDVRRR